MATRHSTPHASVLTVWEQLTTRALAKGDRHTIKALSDTVTATLHTMDFRDAAQARALAARLDAAHRYVTGGRRHA